MNTFDMQTLKIDNDESGITCSKEEREKQLPEARKLMMDRIMGSLEQLKSNNRVPQATNLDRTGTRLELTGTDKKPFHYQKKDSPNNSK